ncbi:SDR family NAD(P)-dependent oxidoreductase [Aridibaculum aurantiacum]|uniref:SDR family NAD(P)-dependent oxidoreductase n=1 Tax=Aridibaculum aurantiacum TaxID=2810307 RepID=UPI001A97AABA|nr:SDR family NAD(P)-dependent oxidoreductase [Aridibaculum aurantiacum]
MNIVITGASKGIGKAVAERFAKEGHSIIICSRSRQSLDAAVADIAKVNTAATVHTYEVDMSIPAQVKTFAAQLIEAALVPDVLINNAGQFIPGSIYNEEEGTLEKMIEVNLYSAYHFTRAMLPAMMERRSGHIFNICSIASLQAYANGGSYSISKFALLGFSKNLREEMKPHGIKVTAVLPGATMTDSWAGADIEPTRIMEANDVAEMIYASSQLSAMAVVEDIVLRPQLGDL